jgi:hypothetical protein
MRSPTPCSGSSLVRRCLMSCLAPYPILMSTFSATFAHLCQCCCTFPRYLGWDSIISMSVLLCSVVQSPVHVFALSGCWANLSIVSYIIFKVICVEGINIFLEGCICV